jgi:hypothetical protein
MLKSRQPGTAIRRLADAVSPLLGYGEFSQ